MGADATCTVTTLEGQATVFIAVNHGTAECVGIHAAKVGSRFEALEPIRQGIKARFGRKEQLPWAHAFATVEELRLALLEWAYQYNEHWLLERHDFLSPSQAQRELRLKQAA